MDRLTKRNEESHVISAINCPQNCPYVTCNIEEGYQCNHECEEAIMYKLAEYEDAEEQGLLLKLPCKVGDTVYEISLVEPYRNPAIRKMGVVDILLRDNDIYFTLVDLYDADYDNSILSTEIGKTIFLTETEAEQAVQQALNKSKKIKLTIN